MPEQTPLDQTLGATRLRTYRERAGRRSPREAIRSAWRYSVFVVVMKSALPILALGLVGIVASYALQSRDSNRVRLTFEQVDKIENDLTMVHPELSGTDNNGMPFTITARSAVQEERGSDRVRLEDVTANIQLKRGGMLHVTATHGVADTKQHLLDVSGGIHLMSDDGYEVRTESASADLKAGTIHGEAPIEAAGKLGRLTAQRFALNQTTGKLRFSGNVQTELTGAPLLREGAAE